MVIKELILSLFFVSFIDAVFVNGNTKTALLGSLFKMVGQMESQRRIICVFWVIFDIYYKGDK